MDKALYLIFGFGLGILVKAAYNTALLNKILNTVIMSKENLDLLLGKVGKLQTGLTNIKGDITRIKDSLPEGAMTAAEVAELSAALDGVVTQADDLDKENEPTTDENGNPL